MWQKCRSNFFAWNWILLKWKKDPDPGSCFSEKRIGFLDPALVGKMDLDPGSCFSENRIGFLDPDSVKKRIRILDIVKKGSCSWILCQGEQKDPDPWSCFWKNASRSTSQGKNLCQVVEVSKEVDDEIDDVDFEALKSLSQDGIDMSFLDNLKVSISDHFFDVNL